LKYHWGRERLAAANRRLAESEVDGQGVASDAGAVVGQASGGSKRQGLLKSPEVWFYVAFVMFILVDVTEGLRAVRLPHFIFIFFCSRAANFILSSYVSLFIFLPCFSAVFPVVYSD
jgi:hypothetical protein